MSKGKKRKPNSGNPAKFTDESRFDDSIWVTTAPTLDGSSYILEVQYSKDRAVALAGPDEVWAHVRAIVDTCARAEYDAAVYKQINKRVKDSDGAFALVRHLRDERPDVVWPGPFSMASGVNEKLVPFVELCWEGEAFAQSDPENMRGHATHLVDCLVTADLDSAYLRALKSHIGLEAETARAVVGDLMNYREGAS